MRKRLLISLAGGVLGVAAAPAINASLELSLGMAMGAFGLGGVVLGYLASIFVDVFSSGSMDEADAGSSE